MNFDPSQLESNLNRLNRYLNMIAQSGSLSGARMEALGVIKQKNPITLRQLSEIQQVRMPTMSKLVDELQHQGLVFRAQSKDDARQRWIVPTQKGLQVLAQAQEQSRQRWLLILESLDEEEAGQLQNNIELLTQKLGDYLRAD